MSKTAYIWGPVSSFSGPMAAGLLQRGWQVHLATKAPWHFALSPLDLRSYATATIEKAFGGHEKFKTFQDRLRLVDVNEVVRGTTYDAFIFCGMPPNFDEQRVSRAPWAASEFEILRKKFKDVPTFIVSSLWGAVQPDGVVPEETASERRKPRTHFESVAQQYEQKLFKALGDEAADCHLVRLPLISGNTVDGKAVNYTGVYTMLEKLEAAAAKTQQDKKKVLEFTYNPDSTFWFLPSDVAVQIFTRFVEDPNRPKICNLVSTQATLNREWVRDLVAVLGCQKSTPVDKDTVGFPTVLRTMLTDNILVKTRNLFEVMGRYQQTPTIVDLVYFERMLAAATEENWGRPVTACQIKQDLLFSEELVRDYFQKFVPSHADCESLRSVTANGAGIGFIIESPDGADSPHKWLLRCADGQTVMEQLSDEAGAPTVTFSFTPEGLMKLIQRKTSLERAIVSREAKIHGKPLDLIKASTFLKRLLKDNPYRSELATATEVESKDEQDAAAAVLQSDSDSAQTGEESTSKSGKKSGGKKELQKTTRARKNQ